MSAGCGTITQEIVIKLSDIFQSIQNRSTPEKPELLNIENNTTLLAQYLWECKGSPRQDGKGQMWDYNVAESLMPILITNVLLSSYFKTGANHTTKKSILTDECIDEVNAVLNKSIDIQKYYHVYKAFVSRLLPTSNNHNLYEQIDWEKYENCNEVHELLGHFIREQILAEAHYDTVRTIDGSIGRMNIEEKRLLDHIGYKLSSWHCVSYEEVDENILKRLVLNQAELFWRYKGCPDPQSHEGQEDDYYNAKRYIAFYITDYLLGLCRKDYYNKCPFTYINEGYIEYLTSLSIEEFLRHKAYHIWMFHGRPDNTSEKDYSAATEYLNDAEKNCRNNCCSEKDRSADRFVENICSCPIEKILSGKTTTTMRLISNINGARINNFVSDLYYHYENDFIDNHKLTPTTYPDNILINVAEYLLLAINCPFIKSLKMEKK